MTESSVVSEEHSVQRYRVAPVDEIPDGGGVMLDIGEREIGVFKHSDRLYAYLNRCIHAGGPVCSGEVMGATKVTLNAAGEVVDEQLDETEMRLYCPWHGWEYDLTTGEVVHDRRLRLRSFDVTVDGGVVYVDA